MDWRKKPVILLHQMASSGGGFRKTLRCMLLYCQIPQAILDGDSGSISSCSTVGGLILVLTVNYEYPVGY